MSLTARLPPQQVLGLRIGWLDGKMVVRLRTSASGTVVDVTVWHASAPQTLRHEVVGVAAATPTLLTCSQELDKLVGHDRRIPLHSADLASSGARTRIAVAATVCIAAPLLLLIQGAHRCSGKEHTGGCQESVV